LQSVEEAIEAEPVENFAEEVLESRPDRDYYEILGIQRVCDQDDVRRAFRTRAKTSHPDKRQRGAMEASEFREITEAYAALSDPVRRAEYDRGGKEALRRYNLEQGEELMVQKRQREETKESLGLLERIFSPLSRINFSAPEKEHGWDAVSRAVEKPLMVTLEDLALGTTKRFAVASSICGTSSEFLQVQIKPLKRFWPAEGYHQNYAERNSVKYNYYRWACGRDRRLEAVWGSRARQMVPWSTQASGRAASKS
jgi:curved DNA-binding protein CbpA